ncbi:MAG: ROK family protein [Bacilli bacterium]|jgi:glucokinase
MKQRNLLISADIGGTNSRFAVVDSDYQIVRSITRRTILNHKDDFVKSIVESIAEIGGDFDAIQGLSLGIPGPIGPNGYIIDLPNIHIKDIPLGKVLRERFKLPVFIRNDAEMACFAEALLGSGKKSDRVFFITISTGLGGALVVNKTFDETPHEIGHTPYTYHGDKKYFEYFASGTGLVNLAKIHDLTIHNSQHFFDLVEQKNEKAILAYHEWLAILGDFLKYIDDHYHPDIIAITGGVFNSKHIFWEELKSEHPRLKLTECHFDQNAGLIGAASYGFTMLNN